MKNAGLALLVIGGIGILALAAVITWFRVTIPPTPDPEGLPSHELAPPAPGYAEVVAEGRILARVLIAAEKLPGLSLAVAVDGEIVWAEGFGLADLETRAPVTPATRFRVGGISEALTSAAVGLLCERSGLDLDAPIDRILPEPAGTAWPVTLRRIMSHTGGVRPHRGEGGIFRGSCDDDAARLAVVTGEPPEVEPGTALRYAAPGWGIVGAVIAHVAEMPYPDFMVRAVFEPLGMIGTGVDADTTDVARFYYPRLMLDPRHGLQDAPEVDLSCVLPAVGFLSTPVDLVRFGAAMMGEGWLRPETIASLQKPVRLGSGELTGRASGWVVRSELMGPDGAPTRIVGQGLGEPVVRAPLSVSAVGGQVAGSTASLLLVPDHRVAVAVAANVSGAGNVPVLARRLADLFLVDPSP